MFFFFKRKENGYLAPVDIFVGGRKFESAGIPAPPAPLAGIPSIL
jgi:hypothetical protein